MNTMIVQRDNTADLLKGFAIVLLVMSHVLQFSAAGTDISYVLPGCSGIVELWARSFNMPLFFFVSGLLLGFKPTPNTLSGTGKAIWHKVRTLLLPGVTFMIFRFILKGTWQMEWFLKALFLIIAVFLIVRWVASRLSLREGWEIALHILIFALWLGISVMWKGEIPSRLCFHRAATAYPYLVMGYFFTITNGKEYLDKHNWILSIAILLYIATFYLSSYVLSGRIAMSINSYLAAPAAILICYKVAYTLKDKQGRIVDAVKYCGAHSIAIYLIHMYFMVHCTAVASYINSVPSSFSLLLQVAFGLACAVPICAICLAIEYVWSQSKWLNLICFGKRS